MTSEFPMKDPQNIWQSQSTEAFKMSTDQLRLKTQQGRRKARFQAVYSIILGFILSIFFAWGFARGHELIPRLGFGMLSLWSIYFGYQTYRWIWPRLPAPNGTLNPTLQSYRSELEKRRDYAWHIWRRAGLTFCFLGVAMIIVPELMKSLHDPRLLADVAPVLVLLAIWCAIFFPGRKRRQRKLQREIEQLLMFERENQS